ncbi:MAG: DUF3857 domain-containing protein [Bacteroidetes bacterium]|nr:MAG: DUF3857 domain-containing protein [Bacteroidota bacterium]
MIPKNLIAALFLFVSGHGLAQQASLNWDATPKPHTVQAANKNESAVILSDRRLHQFLDDDKLGVVAIITNTKLVKVQDDKGVEMYNKIYIPVYSNAELLEIKARTIQPNGTVTNLPDSKILEEEEQGVKYKKFALEGVEKGSEIEYYYKMKRGANFFGIERFQSSSTPCEYAELVLESPERLVFTVKGYNGFAVTQDTVIGKQRVVTAQSKNIPALEAEKYANRDAFIQNVQYKLSYNLEKDKNVRLYSWSQLAKNVYGNYTTITEKEMKAVQDFLKPAKINSNLSEEEKIVALEEYLKTNLNIDKDGISEFGGKLEKIVKSKVASPSGLNQLFIASMELLGIKWQIVFPSKRDDLPLDEELENYRLVDDLMFYFPATEQFLEPANLASRYPYVEPYWTGTKGLFLKPTSIGTFKSALASFEDVPLPEYEKSSHNMEVKIALNEALDSLVIQSKQILTGYGALQYRPAFSFLPKDKLDELTRDIIKSVAKSEHIENIKVSNAAMTDCFANKPFMIESQLTNADLIERAGNKILVKMGEVIGPQVQMYQEKPRQLPISMPYPHALDRDIYFTIPTGYTIKNLNDLNFNITDAASGKETMGFVSNYTLNGNELLVKVHEFYKQTDYPASNFEPFTKVINAAANFNKIVLVLEKK